MGATCRAYEPRWLIGRSARGDVMRRHLHGSIAIVLGALLASACGSKPGASDDASATPVASQGRQETVRLSGCVEMAGMDDYVLQRLHIEGSDAQAAPRTTV